MTLSLMAARQRQAARSGFTRRVSTVGSPARTLILSLRSAVAVRRARVAPAALRADDVDAGRGEEDRGQLRVDLLEAAIVDGACLNRAEKMARFSCFVWTTD
jgi:hypothetical protein